MNAAINAHPDAKSRMLMLNKMLEQVSASPQEDSGQTTVQSTSKSGSGQTANDKQ